MKIDLHIHTKNSSCSNLTIKQIIKKAKEKGIGCIAITDHNILTKIPEQNEIIIIPGEEISSSEGHIIALNIKEEIPPNLSALETIKKIREQGGFVILPHPLDKRRNGVLAKCNPNIAKEADAIEIINGRSINRHNKTAQKFAKENDIISIAGSDSHFTDEIGKVYTEIKDYSTKEEVLNEIKQNHGNIHEDKRSRIKAHTKTFLYRSIQLIKKKCARGELTS